MNLENKKQIATIFLAVGLGLVAAYLMSMHVKSSVEAQTKIIAAQVHKQNQELEKRFQMVQGEMKKVIFKQDTLAKEQVNIKKLASRPVVVNQRGKKNVPVVSKTRFAVETPSGKRAVTILIDSLSAVGGLITPGDVVDIIAHLKVPKDEGSEGKQKSVTSMLFQNIKVLAVGTQYEGLKQPPAYDVQQKSRSLNVTLALNPDEAGLLTFAQANGKVQLALRSPNERGTKMLQVASWDTLSDYVLDKQGTELIVPQKRAKITEVRNSDNEIESFIQIFKGGQEQ